MIGIFFFRDVRRTREGNKTQKKCSRLNFEHFAGIMVSLKKFLLSIYSYLIKITVAYKVLRNIILNPLTKQLLKKR